MPDTVHVLNTYPLTDAQVAALRAVSPRLVIEHRPDSDPEAEGDPQAEVLFCDTLLNDLSRWPRLKWMQISAAGIEHLLANPPWQRGVQVTTFSGVAAVAMAEFTITAILAWTRNLYILHGLHIARTWAPDRTALGGRVLRGKTLTIVGYGSVGRETARLAKPFGLRVLAVRNRPEAAEDTGYYEPGTGDPDGSLPDRVYPVSELHAALAEADFVALSLPLTPQTRNLINAEALAAMKPTAYIVNVGRGATIDDDALIAALNRGQIGGACLDVFAQEPLPSSSPLYQVPNLVVTPHMSGVRYDYWDAAMPLFEANLRRYLAGEALLNAVQPGMDY